MQSMAADIRGWGNGALLSAQESLRLLSLTLFIY